MKVWQKQLLLFFVLSAVGIPLLFFLRGGDTPAPVFTGPEGEYKLALVDRGGRPLSDSRGGLQVRLDPFTSYRNQPNQHTGSFSTGAYGFRGGYRGTPRPVVVLGGSAAFGQGLPADSDCFAAVLDGLLEQREVVNAAVVGYLAGQELALMVHRLDDFNPSAYVAFDGWNELFDQWLVYPRETPWDHGFMNLFFSIEKRLHDLQTISGNQQKPQARPSGVSRKEEARRAGITKEMTHRKGKKNTARSAVGSGGAEPVERERILEGIQRNYHAALGRMNDFARARGASFLVVFQPELGGKLNRTSAETTEYYRWCEVYGKYRNLEFSTEYGSFIDRAAAWCAAEGIEYLDLHHHPAFRESDRRLYYDVVHLNEEGHRVAARLIHQRLEDAGFLRHSTGGQP